MTKFKWILSITAVFLCFTAHAQEGAQTQQSTNAGQQVSEPGQETSAAQQQVTDTTAAADAAQTGSTQDTTATSANARTSNTPAVPQATTSQSGSPAVLSGESGMERDGTNNVQRAGMNMAGSPADNLNLDDNKTIDVDSEMKDRQDQSQEKQVSAPNTASAGGTDRSTGKEKAGAGKKNARKRLKVEL